MLEAQGTVICANASIQLNQQLIPELTITTNCPVCDKKYFVLQMNTVSFFMIVIALERTVSKDFLLTLEDEKSDELQQNENIVSQRSKDEKEVIIEQNKKDENNKVHSSDGKHEITTVNSSDPESRSALQTFGRDYSNDGTEMMGWNSRPQKKSRKKNGKRSESIEIYILQFKDYKIKSVDQNQIK